MFRKYTSDQNIVMCVPQIYIRSEYRYVLANVELPGI